MKFFLFSTFLFLFLRNGFSQNNIQPENLHVNIPSAKSNSTLDIAGFINQHFDTDDKKIAAIYNWVTNNIKYDADSIHYVILDEDNEQRVTYALRRKRGVCENFAAIFNDLCLKCGIPSYTIEGFTKQMGTIDRSPHVWCAASIDGNWAFYDPTWDAGQIRNGTFINETNSHFFKIPPDIFIDTHLPFDPLFQFLNYPVTYKEFISGQREKESKKYFNYMDSIKSYEKMERLDQYLSSLSRMKKEGWPSQKIDTKVKRVQLEIELIHQDTDMDLYDAAVLDYNQAIQIFNTFLVYRNNQFQPQKTKEEVESNFNHIQKLIISGKQKLIKVNASSATLQLDTGDLQKRLDDLEVNLKTQQNFIKINLFIKSKSDSATTKS